MQARKATKLAELRINSAALIIMPDASSKPRLAYENEPYSYPFSTPEENIITAAATKTGTAKSCRHAQPCNAIMIRFPYRFPPTKNGKKVKVGEYPKAWGNYAAILSSPFCFMPGYHCSNFSRKVPSSVRVLVCSMRWAPIFDHRICWRLQKRFPTTVLTVLSTKPVETRSP